LVIGGYHLFRTELRLTWRQRRTVVLRLFVGFGYLSEDLVTVSWGFVQLSLSRSGWWLSINFCKLFLGFPELFVQNFQIWVNFLLEVLFTFWPLSRLLWLLSMILIAKRIPFSLLFSMLPR
jgi:hypothetical protein